MAGGTARRFGEAKKLYAYLTYVAGRKGCAWPSFNHLAEKLHVSRRTVIAKGTTIPIKKDND